MSESVWPRRRQPTRLPRPWDSPGKNSGVGCHFLLQCMKVKSESEAGQSCPTLSDPMDCSLPGSSIHGIFQARVLEWSAIAFSKHSTECLFYSTSVFWWLKIAGSVLFSEDTKMNKHLFISEKLKFKGKDKWSLIHWECYQKWAQWPYKKERSYLSWRKVETWVVWVGS